MGNEIFRIYKTIFNGENVNLMFKIGGYKNLKCFDVYGCGGEFDGIWITRVWYG